jgi:hypothetical protein
MGDKVVYGRFKNTIISIEPTYPVKARWSEVPGEIPKEWIPAERPLSNFERLLCIIVGLLTAAGSMLLVAAIEWMLGSV